MHDIMNQLNKYTYIPLSISNCSYYIVALYICTLSEDIFMHHGDHSLSCFIDEGVVYITRQYYSLNYPIISLSPQNFHIRGSVLYMPSVHNSANRLSVWLLPVPYILFQMPTKCGNLVTALDNEAVQGNNASSVKDPICMILRIGRLHQFSSVQFESSSSGSVVPTSDDPMDSASSLSITNSWSYY